MNIFSIIIGLLLLVTGRKLFWIFVGAMGFAGGYDAAGYLLAGQSETTIFIAGIAVGCLGIVLALAFQRLAIFLAGCVGGGVLAGHIFLMASPDSGSFPFLVAFAVGAFLGGLLIGITFPLALIILSSLVGAMLVANGLPVDPQTQTLIFIGAAIFGFIAQFSQPEKGEEPPA